MSRDAASAADVSGGAKTIGAIAFVLAMAIVVLLLVNARPSPDPLDPRSGRPDGARGLVITLESIGIEVSIGRTSPAPGTDDRVLVLIDDLNDAQRNDLLDHVEAGGYALVADPTSSLHGGSDEDGGALRIDDGALADVQIDPRFEANLTPNDCTIGALRELRGLVVPDGLLFPVGPSEQRCFTGGAPTSGVGDSTSFVIVRNVGAGTIVGLGDNELFQNRWLRGADNAALAAVLLAAGTDAAAPPQVTILLGEGSSPTVEDIGSGDDTLSDLVPTWAWMLMVLGAIAFVVFAASRATRLGRVLIEPEVTPMAGSELVSATGNLMERAQHASQAAWLLQHRLHHDLCDAFGVALDAPLADLDRAVSDRAGVPAGQVERVLRASAGGADGLVAVARDVQRIRQLALAAGSGTVNPPLDPTPEEAIR